ncbi:hypothetical protein OSTOST_00084 [Ostertagia ostertagi]
MGASLGDTTTKDRKGKDYQKKTNALITYCDASKLAMTDYKHPITVPKMEMNAVTKVILLSDSEIVSELDKKVPSERQGTGHYVKNRVKEVHSIFGYIDTKQNSADIGTRGASAEELGVSHNGGKPTQSVSITESSIGSSLFNITPQDNNHEEKELEKTFMNALTTRRQKKIKDLMDLSRYSCKRKSLESPGICHNVPPKHHSLIKGPAKKQTTRTSDSTSTHDHKRSISPLPILNNLMMHCQKPQKRLVEELNLMRTKTTLLEHMGVLNKSDLDEERKTLFSRSAPHRISSSHN